MRCLLPFAHASPYMLIVRHGARRLLDELILRQKGHESFLVRKPLVKFVSFSMQKTRCLPQVHPAHCSPFRDFSSNNVHSAHSFISAILPTTPVVHLPVTFTVTTIPNNRFLPYATLMMWLVTSLLLMWLVEAHAGGVVS